jgi:sarcosine oxidase gamma subunit
MTGAGDFASHADRPEVGLWTTYPVWSEVAIEREGWQAKPLLGLHQLAINGDVRAACAALAPEASEVGLWGRADVATCLVCLARDRALLVSPRQIETDGTWQAGWVASDCDDAFLVIELSGPRVTEIVAEGTSSPLDAGSPSASVLFAGVIVALYRIPDDRVRIHVPSDMAPYLWRWLETR